MARTMIATGPLGCRSVIRVCVFFLVFGLREGFAHNTAVGNSGLDTLAGTIGNHNGVRCPWACNCGGQELDCAQRGLTQVPGNLAALTLAEKL